MTHPAPAVKNHEPSCESATEPTCECSCLSLLHQCDVLDAALQPRRPARADMPSTLRALFGSAFIDFSDPGPTQSTRREWTLLSTPPAAAKTESQREQRAVDVCLHDVLARVHTVAPTNGQWLALGNQLRARTQWRQVAASVDAAMAASATTTSKRARGYFWSSMLACAAALLDAGMNAPSAAQITSVAMRRPYVSPGTVDPLPAGVPWTARVAYPRRKVAEVIHEATVPAAVDAAAQVISDALRSSRLPPIEQLVVTGTVGIAICPDLWQSPAATHYLLIPTLRTLRNHYGATHSLDNYPRPGDTAENLIEQILGEKWASWRGRGGLW